MVDDDGKRVAAGQRAHQFDFQVGAVECDPADGAGEGVAGFRADEFEVFGAHPEAEAGAVVGPWR